MYVKKRGERLAAKGVGPELTKAPVALADDPGQVGSVFTTNAEDRGTSGTPLLTGAIRESRKVKDRGTAIPRKQSNEAGKALAKKKKQGVKIPEFDVTTRAGLNAATKWLSSQGVQIMAGASKSKKE